MTREISHSGRAAQPFIRDLEPIFFRRPITYVDVGAHNGSVFRQLLESPIWVREAHLIEPNPRTFETLRADVADINNVKHMVCHNVALDAVAGTVTMRDEDDMTHTVTEQPGDPAAGFFEVDSTTLDDLIRRCQIKHINLLKIDVEGHELRVLEGAKRTLAGQKIDVIYIETGMNPDSEQHAYYRSIEDALHAYGYRIFHFYEQTHEWLDDSMLLRRTNLAFVSSSFAERHPYKLSHELVRLRERSESLEARVASLQEELSAMSTVKRERDEAMAAAQRELGTAERLLGERDAFVQYANELELRYRCVLRSRTWRVMRPVRLAGRTLRRLRGSPSARNKLPKRPALADGSSGSLAAE